MLGQIEPASVFNDITDVPLTAASHRLTDDYLNTAGAVRVDGANKRIIIRDRSGNDRILIGYQEGGF